MSVYLLYNGRACSIGQHVALQAGRGAIVAVYSSSTDLAWSVDAATGQVGMAETVVHGINIEWAQGHFCMRWLGDLRLIEVAMPGSADEFVLRTGRYRCDRPAQQFEMRGQSVWSVGAQSYVNIRDTWHVRAHGNTGPPWKPMTKETQATRVMLAPMASQCVSLSSRMPAPLCLDPPACSLDPPACFEDSVSRAHAKLKHDRARTDLT